MNPPLAGKVAKALRYKALGSAAIALLYGASPIDVIPDIIPILGLLDDAVVVPAFLLLAFFQLKKSRRVAANAAPVLPPSIPR